MRSSRLGAPAGQECGPDDPHGDEPAIEDDLPGGHTLARVAVRGAAVMLQGQMARMALQAASVVILSRLLTPRDFGVVAMVTVIVGVAAVFRDFGLIQAAVQARTLTNQAKSNLFWINASLGLMLASVVVAGAPVVAWIYGRADLQPVVRVVAITFFLNGLTAQFRAQLSRSMRFVRLTSAEVAAQSTGLVVAIVLAASGAGYWAIAYQQVAEATALVILSALASGWWPRWYSRSERMADLMRFGSGMVGTQLVVYASQNVDSLSIGRNFGAVTLGFYNRAFQLLMLPINQVSSPASKVALPVLSRLQDDEARFRAYLLRAQLMISTAVVWTLLFCVATADHVVRLLLGPGWESTADLFRILGVAGCFQVLSYSTFWVFTSRGRTASNFRFTLSTRCLLICAVVLGAQHGVTWVALAYTSGLIVIWPLGLFWTRRLGPSVDMFASGIRTLGWGGAGAAAAAVTAAAVHGPNLLSLAAAAGAMVLTLVVVGMCTPSLRRDTTHFLDAVRKAVRT